MEQYAAILYMSRVRVLFWVVFVIRGQALPAGGRGHFTIVWGPCFVQYWGFPSDLLVVRQVTTTAPFYLSMNVNVRYLFSRWFQSVLVSFFFVSARVWGFVTITSRALVQIFGWNFRLYGILSSSATKGPSKARNYRGLIGVVQRNCI